VFEGVSGFTDLVTGAGLLGIGAIMAVGCAVSVVCAGMAAASGPEGAAFAPWMYSALLARGLGLAGFAAGAARAGAGPTGSLRILGSGFSESELGAAELLALQGRQVILRAEPGDVKTSDLLLDGVPYDVYTPTTGSVRSIINAIVRKGKQVNGGGVVLDLSKSPLSAADLGDLLARVRQTTTKITDIIIIEG
jgi:contact-dependent growth inhibition (CDI) system CdiA-like toxin